MAFVNKKESGAKTIVKGFLTGGSQASITYPVEFVKTQLQLQSKTNPQFSGMGDCFKQTVSKHGLTGLYTGAPVRILGAGCQQMCRWGAYTNINAMFDETTMLTRVIAGIGAGSTEAILAVTPVETIKTRVTDDARKGTGKYSGSLDAIVKIVKSEGPAGLYKGVIPTVAKQATNQAIRMPLQMVVFNQFAALGIKADKSSPLMNGLAGTVAGSLSVLCTQPQDCIKTRMQGEGAKAYSGTLDCAKQMMSKEGIGAFFAGSLPRCVQVGMTTGVSFAIYPIITKMLNEVWD